jgi:hypothetical protein
VTLVSRLGEPFMRSPLDADPISTRWHWRLFALSQVPSMPPGRGW